MDINLKRVFFFITIVIVGYGESAQAYLDPSTGSMLLSALIGMFATIILVIKTYWYKLKSFFRKTPQGQNRQR